MVIQGRALRKQLEMYFYALKKSTGHLGPHVRFMNDRTIWLSFPACYYLIILLCFLNLDVIRCYRFS